MAHSWLAAVLIFTIVSIAASRLGVLFPKIGLPLITGYLVVGALAGPFVLNVVESPDISNLGFVTKFALAFIAFSAGAELYLPELRSLFKRILYMTSLIAVVTFVVSMPVIYGLGSSPVLPFMNELAPGCRMSVAAIASSIMVARSPASAIAVVKELRAKGLFTSTLLGVTVLCDVYVLMGFTLTTTIAESSCKDEGFSGMALLIMAFTIAASIGIGYLIGKLLIALMWFKRFPARYLILPLGLAIFMLTDWFTEYSHEHLPYILKFEALLICITAGYVCTNQSKNRHRFISVLQSAGPWVFLPFFTLTGASLDLRVLVSSLGFAVLVALIRAICIFIGSATGGKLSGAPASHSKLIWMTLLTQAGVSLGLASEVGFEFPGWGRAFQTAIISVVLINQILGPILFRIAVRRVGEAGKAAAEEGFDADAVVPTALVLGDTPQALSVATRLLKDHWRVVLVAPTEATAAATRAEIKAFAEAQRAASSKGKSMLESLLERVVKAPLQAVEGVRDQISNLEAKASGKPGAAAAAAAGAAGASGATTTSTEAGVEVTAVTVVPDASAPAPAAAPAEEALDEHGHPKRKLEDMFEAVGLMPDGTADWDNPFLKGAVVAGVRESGAEASGASGGAAATEGVDSRYERLTSLVTSTRTLQSIAVALPSDLSSFAACRAITTTIAAAPKKSSLHSVRLVAHVNDPEWGAVFEEVGVTPLQNFFTTSLVMGKALTAPAHRPLVLMRSVTNHDLAVNMQGATDGPFHWAWLYRALGVTGSTDGVGPASATVATVLAAVRPPAAANGLVGSATGMMKSLVNGSALKSALKSMNMGEAEEVPEWQRDAYLDALGGTLSHDASSLEGRLSATSKTRKVDQLSMFGSISSGLTGKEEDEEHAGRGTGLAAQDGNATTRW